MSAPIWVTPAKFLGTVTERISSVIQLEVENPANTTFSVISGSLPLGLKISNTGTIIGTPFNVGETVSSQFVVRATNSSGVTDRTFVLHTQGPTPPEWVTPAGYLPVGKLGRYFALNKQYIEYQLSATYDTLPAGQKLRYYINDLDGELPPGVTLTEDGKLVGRIMDNLSLDDQISPVGGYDKEPFEGYPYDHAIGTTSTVVAVKPAYLSKLYQFYVTVTDGVASSRRLFSIKVDDPSEFRVDNTFIVLVDPDDTIYTADASYIVTPDWVTPIDLGVIRANNRQVIQLDMYDPYPNTGPTYYSIPPAPVWSSTSTYVKGDRVSTSSIHYVCLVNSTSSVFNYSDWRRDSLPPNFYLGSSDYLIGGEGVDYVQVIDGGSLYTATSVLTFSNAPAGGRRAKGTPIIQGGVITGVGIYDSGWGYTTPPTITITSPTIGINASFKVNLTQTRQNGVLYANLPYQPAYSQTYNFTLRLTKGIIGTTSTTYVDRTFAVTIRGDVENTINFITDANLGTVIPGYRSELAIVAKHSVDAYSIKYELVDGVNYPLPSGLSLAQDGTIVGVPNKFVPTTFDFALDNGLTTIDQSTRVYHFTVKASDVYLQSSITKDFYITLGEPTGGSFVAMYFKPFMQSNLRTTYVDFINNTSIFDRKILYRQYDPAFGLQQEMKFVLEYGIEARPIADYSNILSNYLEYFKRQRFFLGAVKSSVAKDKNRNIIYEVVYVEVLDEQERTIDNMRTILEDNLAVDEYRMPTWMRTIQGSTGSPIGYVKSIPLCYTLPGNSDQVIKNIKASGFDFSQLNFTVDRLIIS